MTTALTTTWTNSAALAAAFGLALAGCDQKPKAPAAPAVAAAAPNAEAPAAPHPDMAAGPEAARPPATLTQVKAVMADCTNGAADLGVMSAEAAAGTMDPAYAERSAQISLACTKVLGSLQVMSAPAPCLDIVSFLGARAVAINAVTSGRAPATTIAAAKPYNKGSAAACSAALQPKPPG